MTATATPTFAQKFPVYAATISEAAEEFRPGTVATVLPHLPSRIASFFTGISEGSRVVVVDAAFGRVTIRLVAEEGPSVSVEPEDLSAVALEDLTAEDAEAAKAAALQARADDLHRAIAQTKAVAPADVVLATMEQAAAADTLAGAMDTLHRFLTP